MQTCSCFLGEKTITVTGLVVYHIITTRKLLTRKMQVCHTTQHHKTRAKRTTSTWPLCNAPNTYWCWRCGLLDWDRPRCEAMRPDSVESGDKTLQHLQLGTW